MKAPILGIALLATCMAASAQSPTGSAIGSNTGGTGSVNQPRPAPLPLPSTGTSVDTAGARGTSPRGDTSVGTSGMTPDIAGPSSGRCDTLIGDERLKCLREQASTGTAGAGSTGMGSGSTR